jgi:predicted DNA-binding transcriptional regulator AlpA
MTGCGSASLRSTTATSTSRVAVPVWSGGDPMTDPENTIPHHSYCDWCGILFTPRVVAGPKRGRFCTRKHKDHWWNRRRKTNPPSVAADSAGDDQEQRNSNRSMPSDRYIILTHRGSLVALTPEQLGEGQRLARQLDAAAQRELQAGEPYLDIRQVVEYAGISRAWVYYLMSYNSFPRPVLLSLRPRRRVGWRSTEVRRWLEQRARAAA